MVSFEYLKQNLSHIPGKRFNKKYIIIESDDWGSLRVGTKDALRNFKKHGLFIDDPYIQKDSIASQDDLEKLFEVITSVKDCIGNHPVITANTNVANPDFQKIKETNFEEYHYELFTETIKRLGDRGDPLSLFKEGIEKGIFIPQYHGREHLNVKFWMDALKANHRDTRIAFDCGAFGLITDTPFSKKKHYLAAYDFANMEETVLHTLIIKDGIKIFNELFGYIPSSFISPQFIWHPLHEKALVETGIKVIQGQRKQIIPKVLNKKYLTEFRYIGKKTAFGQFYNVRNCVFEPYLNNIDWVNSCLRDIQLAFKWGKPAVISSHRVNYIGVLSPVNRDNSLMKLKELIYNIISKWPDAHFITTEQLFTESNTRV